MRRPHALLTAALLAVAPLAAAILAGCDEAAPAEATPPDARLGRPDDTGLIPVLDAERDSLPTADADPITDAAPDADPITDAARDAAAPDARVIACGEFSARARGAVEPVDIVWLIDASPSMAEEIALIEANLNAFADRIGASGLDHHVVIVGADRDLCADGRCYFEICVPPPLSAAPGCPDTDSERYRHVRAPIHSRELLDVAVTELDAIAAFLRAGVTTHVIAVTDDDIGFGRDAHEFLAAVAPVMPSMVFHSIVDEIGRLPSCGLFGEPPCSCGENRGETYITISDATGGLVQSVCSEDWDPIFAALEARVVDGARIPCTFDLPERPRGLVLDPERVNVDLVTPGGDRRPLFNVDDAAGCARDDTGWYLDDAAAPTRLSLCPGACGEREGDVEVEFGCVMRKL
ncbi:MAG: hypothetical protein H6703_10325 [Myxococcales bacterium]|nr:hypothetical protein [Myxococcales bacterium]MCB9542831.1 hypothetical protein [Myxococcales bacterium]